MALELKCPACRQTICFPSSDECDEDLLESLCTRCKYKYALINTEVIAFASRAEENYPSRYRKQTSYQRLYELRLLTPNDNLKAIELSTRGLEEKISGRPGDRVLLLYIMSSKAVGDLLWLENPTTGKSLLLQKPGAKARSKGIGAGVLTFVAGGVLATMVHLPDKILLAAGIPSAVGVGAYVTRLKSPKTRDKRELTRLASEQQLLSQKFELEQRTQDLHSELEANQRTSRRLQELRRKMQAEMELYGDRIETISMGIGILEQQIELTLNLISGYTKIINILTIEFETSRLAEQLPEDISGQILNRIEELKVIEAKREELSLLISPQRLLSKY